MIFALLTIITILALITISISVYRKKHTIHPQTPIELVATNIAETIDQKLPIIISHTNSKYCDKLHIGKLTWVCSCFNRRVQLTLMHLQRHYRLYLFFTFLSVVAASQL